MLTQKTFRSRPETENKSQSDTLLHLVDDRGRSVEKEVRLAVEAAFRRVLCRFRSVDEALLANWAERLAASMAGRRILAVKQYAFRALNRRAMGWLTRARREVTLDQSAELDHAMQVDVSAFH